MIQVNPYQANYNQKPTYQVTQEYNKQGNHSNPNVQTNHAKLALINKNYILPQNTSFQGESNYVDSYKNNSNSRVKTQRVTHQNNQVIPQGRFQGNSSYLNDYVNAKGARSQIKRQQGQLKVGGKFEGLSNYNENYINNGTIPKQQKVIHQNNKIMPEGKFQNMSTYNGNYIANPMEKREKIKHQGSLKVNGGQFVGQSTYGGDYIQSYIEKNMQIKPQGQLKIGGQFYGQSNYHQNYRNKGLIGKQQKYALPQNKVFPEGRFQDNTTYNGNYIENQIQKIRQIKPQSQLKVGGGKFDSLSNYNHDYIGKNAQQKTQKVVYKQNEILPKGNFQGNSTYQQNYIQTENQNRQKPYKLEGQLKIGGQFYGESNYNQNYYNKGAQSRPQKVSYPPNYVMPQGAFQNGTTYTGNYHENPIQRNIAVKPQGQLKLGNQHFQGTSNYNSDYVAWEAQKRREKVVYSQNAVMPKGNFSGNSTYVDAYVPSAIEKNRQIRPQNNLQIGGKFEGNTSYTQDYDRNHDYPRYLSKQNEYVISKR